MITKKDATEEMLNARNIIQNEKTTVIEKIKAISKVVEVILKVVLSNRTNVVRLMEAKGVEKLPPRKREEDKVVDEKKEEEPTTEDLSE